MRGIRGIGGMCGPPGASKLEGDKHLEPRCSQGAEADRRRKTSASGDLFRVFRVFRGLGRESFYIRFCRDEAKRLEQLSGCS